MKFKNLGHEIPKLSEEDLKRITGGFGGNDGGCVPHLKFPKQKKIEIPKF